MRERKTRIALYARKSKYTEKGQSIQNQIEECKCYIERNFQGESYEIRLYQDEGISGKNLERPEMQRMLGDIAADEIDVLICYRLDRVSRSVRDFSNLIDDLQARDKEFVSVREKFDTRTPMGRAMIMICSVFSQLERETIAERITDNLYALAKTGRWLGGNVPLGFESERVVEEDGLGKRRSRYRLVSIPEEQERVRLIFTKYRELGSLTKLETFLMNAGYRTKKNNTYFGRYVLRAMLTNPVYCIADRQVFSYMKEHRYGIYAEESLFDGEHGLIAYNKNNNRNKTHRHNEVQDWVVAVGEHRGVIDSSLWIRVQDQIRDRERFSYRNPKKSDAILSGIVRCAGCGALMRPKVSRRAKDGTLRYSYVCQQKERSRGERCQVPNIPGMELEAMVVGEIFRLRDAVIMEYGFLEREFDRLEGETGRQNGEAAARRQMECYQRQTDALMKALERSSSEETTDSILRRMDEINEQRAALQMDLEKKEAGGGGRLKGDAKESLAEGMLSMDVESFGKLPAAQKRDILGKAVREILWDGECADVHLQAEELPEVSPV